MFKTKIKCLEDISEQFGEYDEVVTWASNWNAWQYEIEGTLNRCLVKYPEYEKCFSVEGKQVVVAKKTKKKHFKSCLRCGENFFSMSSGNRMCSTCLHHTRTLVGGIPAKPEIRRNSPVKFPA